MLRMLSVHHKKSIASIILDPNPLSSKAASRNTPQTEQAETIIFNRIMVDFLNNSIIGEILKTL